MPTTETTEVNYWFSLAGMQFQYRLASHIMTAMTVNLPSDIAALVDARVQNGDFPSPEDMLRAAVQSLERETERSRQEAKLRSMLEAAARQVESGETLDADQAFDEVEMELFGHKLADE